MTESKPFDDLTAEKEEELKVKLTVCLNFAFPNAGKVLDVSRPTSGANREGHLILHLKSEKYSLKTWPAAAGNNQTYEFCAERERLMYCCAQLVETPHLCQLQQIFDFNYPAFSGHPATISRWLQNSENLESLGVDTVEKIKTAGYEFFHQFGQWLAFGAAVGYQDWTRNNFVWADHGNKLAMIDLDWCFENTFPFSREPAEIFKQFSGLKKSNKQVYLTSLKTGIEEMNSRIEKHLDTMNSFAQSAKDTNTQAFRIELSTNLEKQIEEIESGIIARE
jgi:hypothetical protein